MLRLFGKDKNKWKWGRDGPLKQVLESELLSFDRSWGFRLLAVITVQGELFLRNGTDFERNKNNDDHKKSSKIFSDIFYVFCFPFWTTPSYIFSTRRLFCSNVFGYFGGPLIDWKNIFVPTTSVTRFGKISPLWYHLKVFCQFLDGLLNISQTFEPIWTHFYAIRQILIVAKRQILKK